MKFRSEAGIGLTINLVLISDGPDTNCQISGKVLKVLKIVWFREG